MIIDRSIDEWLNIAHDKQLNIFESIFTEKLRQSWK
jgi:uncharacterized protein (TIGR04255 family)